MIKKKRTKTIQTLKTIVGCGGAFPLQHSLGCSYRRKRKVIILMLIEGKTGMCPFSKTESLADMFFFDKNNLFCEKQILFLSKK